MSFAIQTHRLPVLTSHQDCKEWFEKTELPKRAGWEDNWRPLDRNTMPHKRLVKRNDGSYSCTLYRCDHVVYHEDGQVEVQLYPSNSSMAFLGRMLPAGIDTHNSLLRVETEEGLAWFASNGHPFLLRPCNNNSRHWQVIGGSQERRREFTNKEKSVEVRQLIKPFMSWYKATEKLIGWKTQIDANPSQIRHLNVTNSEHWLELANFMRDPDKFRDAMYRTYGAKEIRVIPNTVPPSRVSGNFS